MSRFFAISSAILLCISSSVSAQVVGNRPPAVDTSTGTGDFITASSPLPDGGAITSTVYGGTNASGPNYFIENAIPQTYAPAPGYQAYQQPPYGYGAYGYGYQTPQYGYQTPQYGYQPAPYGYQPPNYGYQPQPYQQAYNPYPPRYAAAPNGYGNQVWANPQNQQRQPQQDSQQRPQERFAQANWPNPGNVRPPQNTERQSQAPNNSGQQLNYQLQPRSPVQQAAFQQSNGQSFQNNLNGLQWRTASRTAFQTGNPACCGQPQVGFQPPTQLGYQNPNPNPYGASGAGYGFNRAPVGGYGYAPPPTPGYGYAGYGQQQRSPYGYGTNPYGYGQPWRPLIPLRQIPPGVYVGQGIIGQPVAFVNGEPVRNFLRYIFP